MNLTLKILLKLYFLIFLVAPLHSEEKKEVFNEHELNFYT